MSYQKPRLGTWLTIPSAHLVDVIASTGVDFLALDREHGNLSLSDIFSSLAICRGRNVQGFVRSRSFDPQEIAQILDAGPDGIMFAGVETAAQAAHLLRYVSPSPLGSRGFSPYVRAFRYGETRSPKGQEFSVIMCVESIGAVREAKAILALEGVSGVFVGLYDLSVSIGVPGDLKNKKLWELCQQVVSESHAAGKEAWTIAPDDDLLRDFVGLNFDGLLLSVDTGVISEEYMRRVAVGRR